jgi:alpha-methylacyl-CoA racemase
MDREQWPELKERIAEVFRTRTRDEWCAELEGSDVCFAPVLTIAEAREHPHNRARGTFVEFDGVAQPRPAPRFSRTDSEIQRPPSSIGQHTDEVLEELGWSHAEISALREQKAIG